MPTSSQALILYKADPPNPRPSQHAWLRNVAPYSQAGVYNLNGCMPMTNTGVQDNHAVRALGKDSAQLFKYHSLPKGLTSILSFDQITQRFRWEAIGGADSKPTEKHISFSSSCEDQASLFDTHVPRRPHSALSVIKKPKVSVNQLEYDHLLDLGFRSRSLLTDDTVQFEHRVTRTKSGPTSTSRKREELRVTRAKSSGAAAAIDKQRPVYRDMERPNSGC